MDREERVNFVSKYFKKDIPEKYLNYYKTATELYLDGKIKQYRSLEKIVINYQVIIIIEKQLKLLKNLKDQNQ